MIPIAAIPVGRDTLKWRISGHVTTMLAVPLIQLIDPRLTGWEKVCYWIPFPIVFLMHWYWFDRIEHGGRVDHKDTNRAMVAACLLFLCAQLAAALWR
jgi:hypothetical protein